MRMFCLSVKPWRQSDAWFCTAALAGRISYRAFATSMRNLLASCLLVLRPCRCVGIALESILPFPPLAIAGAKSSRLSRPLQAGTLVSRLAPSCIAAWARSVASRSCVRSVRSAWAEFAAAALQVRLHFAWGPVFSVMFWCKHRKCLVKPLWFKHKGMFGKTTMDFSGTSASHLGGVV